MMDEPCTQVTNLFIDIREQMQNNAIRCACSTFLLNRLRTDVDSQVHCLCWDVSGITHAFICFCFGLYALMEHEQRKGGGRSPTKPRETNGPQRLSTRENRGQRLPTHEQDCTTEAARKEQLRYDKLNAKKQAARLEQQSTTRQGQRQSDAQRKAARQEQRQAAAAGVDAVANPNRADCPLAHGQTADQRALDEAMLAQSQHNEHSAQIAFWERTGLDLFPLLDKVEEGTATEQDIQALEQQIKSLALTQEDQMRICQQWATAKTAKNLSVNRTLYACGVCGIRDLSASYTLHNLRTEPDELFDAQVAAIDPMSMDETPKRPKRAHPADATFLHAHVFHRNSDVVNHGILQFLNKPQIDLVQEAVNKVGSEDQKKIMRAFQEWLIRHPFYVAPQADDA